MIKRVIIVDDHPFSRLGLRTYLEQEGMEVVAETGSGVELPEQVRALEPDLVIIDTGLAKTGGLHSLKSVQALNMPVKILVLTSQASAYFAQRCSQAGADGFIIKTGDLSELGDAIRLVMRGNSYFPTNDNSMMSPGCDSLEDARKLESLTNRELSIMMMLVRGLDIQQMADELQVHRKTITTYKHHVMRKLGVDSLMALMEFARQNSLL